MFSSLALKSQSLVKYDDLTKVLENIYTADQEPRLIIDSLIQKFGYNSTEVRRHFENIAKIDSANIAIVSKIIDQNGWLSATETSVKANEALFLVIQHADITTRLKYLPLLKIAVEQNKAKATNYAYLLDRTLMDQGKFQIYGSQLSGPQKGELEFYPIGDEQNVNIRRKAIGLEPLENYAKGLTATNYTLPAQDIYQNKFVIILLVFDTQNNPLSDALVYSGNNKLIGKTDKFGKLKLVLKKEYRNWALLIRKDGYTTSSYALESNNKDVFTMGFRLAKKEIETSK